MIFVILRLIFTFKGAQCWLFLPPYGLTSAALVLLFWPPWTFTLDFGTVYVQCCAFFFFLRNILKNFINRHKKTFVFFFIYLCLSAYQTNKNVIFFRRWSYSKSLFLSLIITLVTSLSLRKNVKRCQYFCKILKKSIFSASDT